MKNLILISSLIIYSSYANAEAAEKPYVGLRCAVFKSIGSFITSGEVELNNGEDKTVIVDGEYTFNAGAGQVQDKSGNFVSKVFYLTIIRGGEDLAQAYTHYDDSPSDFMQIAAGGYGFTCVSKDLK